jgi:DNA-binding NarL/FixJ family response regulator
METLSVRHDPLSVSEAPSGDTRAVSARAIRILIADDHPVIRKGIRNILATEHDLDIVDEAGDGLEILSLARTVEHDLVLLDLSMPHTNGLDALKRLKHENPDIPVLVLTMHAEHQFAIRALKSGASGYLVKDAAPTELVGAIRKVIAGGRYLSAYTAEQLAAHLNDNPERPPHELLSDREFQVFQMIAAGWTTRQIATDLHLSVKTVATYRIRIFKKMQMRTAAELAAYAVRNALSDPATGL